MAIVDIKIPQMGEGLTEVRLIEFLKRPGDTVSRDELIYTMETDKATLEVESPEAGKITEWLASEGDVLPIGASVARIDIAEAPAEEKHVRRAPQTVAPPSAAADRVIPPRTRAYARELGLAEETLAGIPAATAKLMPSDLDLYLRAAAESEQRAEEVAAPAFEDLPLPERQRKLIFHLKRSMQTVIQGTLSRPVEWVSVRQFADASRQESPQGGPTEFQIFAYCATQATREHPKFRSTLVREDTIRQYERLHLGIAVALPGGELTTAVVQNADTLTSDQFFRAVRERIHAARSGEDQADASVQLLLTYLGAYGVRDAVPVLVAPAAAVLFLGDAYEDNGKLLANVALTIDHRLMNGVEAAEYLSAVAARVQQLSTDTA